MLVCQISAFSLAYISREQFFPWQLAATIYRIAIHAPEERTDKPNSMPLIAPAQLVTTERKPFRLAKDLLNQISIYAEMISSPEDHIVSSALQRFFRADKDFRRYVAEHPFPSATGKRKRGRPPKAVAINQDLTNTKVTAA